MFVWTFLSFRSSDWVRRSMLKEISLFSWRQVIFFLLVYSWTRQKWPVSIKLIEKENCRWIELSLANIFMSITPIWSLALFAAVPSPFASAKKKLSFRRTHCCSIMHVCIWNGVFKSKRYSLLKYRLFEKKNGSNNLDSRKCKASHILCPMSMN